MGELALSQRLKLVTDEFFDGDQKAVATAMGVSEPYVSLLINGKRHNLKSSLVEKLVNSMNMGPLTGAWIHWIGFGGPMPLRKPKGHVPLRSHEEGAEPAWTRSIPEEQLIDMVVRNLTDREIDLQERLDRSAQQLEALRLRAVRQRMASLTGAVDTAEGLAALDEFEEQQHEHPKHPPTRKAGEPSAGKLRPSGGASQGSKARRASATPAQGEPRE